MNVSPRPERSTKVPPGDLVVFDGSCVFCSGFVHFLARHDPKARFRFVTAQSPTGRALYVRHGLDPELMTTNIVIIDGRPYVKMASLTAAMAAIGWPWRALGLLGRLPRPIADRIYDAFAHNRYLFGRRRCPLPSPELRARLIE